jgi:type I restriction enzyme, S subunit
MKRFELKSGDLIMSCSGTMGKIAIVPEDFKKGIINQALLKLTPSKKISNVFLKLWMQSESFQDSLNEFSGGAAIQNVASVAILKQIEIPLPPFPEQQRIVSILDEAFAAIAKAKANAEQNLKNAKELFESYLQGVFERKGDDWEEQPFENCFKLKSGDNLTAKNMTEGEYPVFGGNGIAGYHNDYNLSGSNVIIGRVNNKPSSAN